MRGRFPRDREVKPDGTLEVIMFGFRRLAHILGLQEKDEALSKRFSKIRQLYGEPESQQPIVDVVSGVRHGFNMRAVVGAQKTTGEQLRKNLLESYARSGELDREPVASK
jgi:hypothetical protein